MSDSERELRDRLEEAQGDLKRANARLDELEGVATDRDTLRAQLEAAQAELKAANERLDELEDQSTEALTEELDEVSRDRDLLRQRLEQADKTREQWDQKVAQREAELAAARAEEWRLREELATISRPKERRPRRPWLFALPAVSLGAAALLLLRACAT